MSGFDLQKHKATGQKLKNVREQIIEVAQDINRHYGSDRVCLASGCLLKSLDALRSQLEGKLFNENKTSTIGFNELASIYYGANESGTNDADIYELFYQLGRLDQEIKSNVEQMKSMVQGAA